MSQITRGWSQEEKRTKSRLYDVFYGETETAPMIKECPINYELKLSKTVELDRVNLFIGDVVKAYVDKDKTQGHQPDVPALNPFILLESPANRYHDLGPELAHAFKVGKALFMNK